MTRHPTITSPSNPRVRAAARLRDGEARRESGLTLVDGGRELRRAVAAGVVPVELFLDERRLGRVPGQRDADDPSAGLPTGGELDAWLDDLAARGTSIVLLAPAAFAKVAFGDRNEGCVAVVPFRGHPLAGFTPRPDRPVMIVEGVEKPGNLGAILRTADAAGLAGVIACGGGTDPANPATIRASLGTVFSVALAAATVEEAVRWCAGSGRRVVAACPGAAIPWHQAGLAGPVAILLGSEAHGISDAWQAAAGAGRLRLDRASLPMHGLADSLNVAATAAVLAYESVRQAAVAPTPGTAAPPLSPHSPGPPHGTAP